METFFMNSKNSKTNEPNLFKYNLIDKLDLKNPNKNMALANLNIYYTWKNIKKLKNIFFHISLQLFLQMTKSHILVHIFCTLAQVNILFLY